MDLLAGQVRWPLYMYGPTGVGKTYAAIWLANQVPDSALFDHRLLVDAAWDRDHPRWRRLQEALLVVIDEIGLRSSDWDYMALKRAADLREWRPTVWISNLTPDQLLQAYDDRIVSRLCCGTVVCVEGPDQRFLRGSKHGA